jgi:putative DNA primase/helicase
MTPNSRGSRRSRGEGRPTTVPRDDSGASRRRRNGEKSTTVSKDNWRGPLRSPDKKRPTMVSTKDSSGSDARHDEPTVWAWARTTDSNNWHRMLKFRDRDRKPHTILLKPEDETKPALAGLLKRHGYTMPTDKGTWTKTFEKITTAEPKRRVLMVERPGWHDDQFLLGSDTIGTGGEIVMADWAGSHIARIAHRADIVDWQSNIAAVAAYSSYLVFALCAGFSAPLLHLTGVRSGGFHFWGPSSKGKSTLQACVATIFGSGKQHEKGYARDWNITDKAAEELGRGHCDLPLILDELKLLDPNPKASAERASKIIYALADGSSTQRSSWYTGVQSADAKEYRVIVLSAGESSLADHSRMGDARRQDGEAARVIDIPMPRRDEGIFDLLPRNASGRAGSLLLTTP